jgi:hypothetical protein
LATRANEHLLDRRAPDLILAASHAVPFLHAVIVVVRRRAVISALVGVVVRAPEGMYRMIQ